MSVDFVKIRKRNKNTELYPDFQISRRTSDLMIRGRKFYAIWDEEAGLWSTNEYDVERLVDKMLYEENEKYGNEYSLAKMSSNSSGSWDVWTRYSKRLPDNYHELDENITFLNTKVKKEDYVSKRLPYELKKGKFPNYESLISTLYDPEEREKIEWAIGAVISGDSKRIQKFLVLYGDPGSGKGTILNIIQSLFEGYYTMFESKGLGSSSNQFALEDFASNPLVAIEHDGDLSRIEDNTKLNSLISHEIMSVNEKFKNKYTMRFNSFLFIGSNTPVRITDAKSGINRRLIDVHPSGRKLSFDEYISSTNGVMYELGAIAYHCLEVYKERGEDYYANYIPISMISATNDFYNYVVENYETFKKNDSTTLKSAWASYKEYCEYAKVGFPLKMIKFKEELKNYFRDYSERARIDDVLLRNYYSGFKYVKIDAYSDGEDVPVDKKTKTQSTWLNFKTEDVSLFDISSANYPAQYANANGTPLHAWRNVLSKLSDLDTTRLHYVKVPENHIVIDFDIKNEKGEKDLELNIKAASKFPETYAEISKGGGGVHLHYIYDGDVNKLSRIYDDGIEVKIYTGGSALRRKRTKCVNKQIAHINSGLPLRGDVKMLDIKTIKDNRHLMVMIKKCLHKEFPPYATGPSIDFIYKLLEDAYASGMKYDVTPLRPAILAFAGNSTNQASHCLNVVAKMKFKSEEASSPIEKNDGPLVFYDVEVFPNVFILCYKERGPGKKKVKLINPKPSDIEPLLSLSLVGFNNRNYDNHMIYGAYMGYTVEQLFQLSQRIIANSPNAKFSEAYNLSHTDIYDFAAEKKSLKKWEIELGIKHLENQYAWDEPLPKDKWDEVADYCCNDVDATEAVFEHLISDYKARCILAKIAGGIPNDTTNQLSLKFVFGNEKHPKLVHMNLATGEPSEEGKHLEYKYPNAFPGYEHIPGPENKGKGKNMYRDIDLGFGGYVYAKPGMYGPSETFDVSGMHPASAIAMNAFGEYTSRFAEIVELRLAIKHKDLEYAKTLLNGEVAEFLNDISEAKALAKALKIVVNSFYGLTSASFDNPARDPRNINNIVALRGALFMKTLQDEVEKLGYNIIHIKTDSIKVENPDEFIRKFIVDFGRKYGYEFETEHKFEKICLVNDAVYISKLAKDDPEAPGKWSATGAQFKVPYVFKTLFSKEPIEFEDMCETKSVTSSLYLDMNESLPEDEHKYVFVGRVGSFCPIMPGAGGGLLMRSAGNNKYAAATGTKGYRWLESEVVKNLHIEDCIDKRYFNDLCSSAIETINKFGDYWQFVDDVPIN